VTKKRGAYMKTFLNAKIHKARVTDANINYEGSITIDKTLLTKAGIEEYEQVMVVNNTNGNRLFTYALPGKIGEICINGAAAHLMHIDDEIIIMSFVVTDEKPKPKKILVDEKNKFVRYM
jgi:aspartate 1-decarboxylase